MERVLARNVASSFVTSGFQVLEAVNVDEAISIAKSVSVDVVVTDLQMGTAVDGIELAKYVRAHYPHVHLLLSSAHAIPIADGGCFDAFFVKPYDPEHIVKWIKRRQPMNLGHEDSDVA